MSEPAYDPVYNPTPAPVTAAGVWHKLTDSPKSLPHQDRSVLVRLELVGPVYDVAVYRGRDAKGDHRWIHGDINLAHKLITHWAYLNEPEGLEDR